MTVETAEDLAVFFDTGDFGEGATYRPASGPDVLVTVIVDQPTREVQLFGGATRAPAVSVQLRVSEVAQPRKGDSIVIGGTTYAVRDAERDPLAAIWRVTLGE